MHLGCHFLFCFVLVYVSAKIYIDINIMDTESKSRLTTRLKGYPIVISIC